MNPNQIKNDPLPTISETLLKSLAEMEKYYDENNKEYFKDLLVISSEQELSVSLQIWLEMIQ